MFNLDFVGIENGATTPIAPDYPAQTNRLDVDKPPFERRRKRD